MRFDEVNWAEHWAKCDRKTGRKTHSVLFHMMDTANVALQLLEVFPAQKKIIQDFSPLAAPKDLLLAATAVRIGAHDIGKLSPDFHGKKPGDLLFDFSTDFPSSPFDHEFYHGQVTTLFFGHELYGGNTNVAELDIARMSGGHHGRADLRLLEAIYGGDGKWPELRMVTFRKLCSLFGVKPKHLRCKRKRVNHAWLVVFGGLTAISDWIASNENFFPFDDSGIAPEDYMRISRVRAFDAVNKLFHFHREGRSPRSLTFRQVFGFAPNDMQRQAVRLVKNGNYARAIYIIENATGWGKTEAALAIYMEMLIHEATVNNRPVVLPLYFAMPTQSTSDQMRMRLTDMLSRVYPLDFVQCALVHSAFMQDENFMESVIDLKDVDDASMSERAGTVGLVDFFVGHKRNLFAPYGIGTVDQLLQGVNLSSHWFVRLSALAGRVVVIDEVHAYDAFTSRLLERLLAYLGALGSTVILLSATLPKCQREVFCKAYTGKAMPDMKCAYPRITAAYADGTVRFKHLSRSECHA